MRILALDYGDSRIGAAICDELGIAAHGLETIVRKNRGRDMAALSSIIEKFHIERIIVGYPVRMDGSEGIQCEKVNRFIRRLETAFSLPVIRHDETLSTKEAEYLLNTNGTARKKRGRGDVDRVAASVILQSYLDSAAGTQISECSNG